MDVEVNLIAVLAAAVVSMIIGSVWYSQRVFGKTWFELEKIKLDKDQMGAGKAVATSMIGMAILALVMAYVLAHVSYLSFNFFTENDFKTATITTGFWMWLGFVLPVLASNSLFAQKPWKLTFINAGNWLVTLLAMGLTIGLIGL
jgi:hypothetical protein